MHLEIRDGHRSMSDKPYFLRAKMLCTLHSENQEPIIMVNVDNTKSQMRKGMLEYCILLLLRHRPLYANDIISQKDGLLKYEWQESTQGPPRKYYALTDEGEEALQQLDTSWNELTKTVNILHSKY